MGSVAGDGLVPPRWIDAEEVADEEVVAFVIAVGRVAVAAARAVIGPGNHEQIEVLVVLQQLMNYLHRRRRIDVRIHLADNAVPSTTALNDVTLLSNLNWANGRSCDLYVFPVSFESDAAILS